MKETFGFIGCGNMGGALASAVAKTVPSAQITLCDALAEKAETLADTLSANVSDAKIIAQECDFIFLGVKPQGFEALFEEIRPVLRSREDDFVLVSMAAGVSISTVEKLAGIECPVIRIMPNTPVSVEEGMILYTTNDKVSDEQLKAFKSSLLCAGVIDAISEDKIDAASALSGCGPAFVYMFAEALADGAVECGLMRDKANLYAAQTLIGAAKLLIESDKHPGQLKDEVCSPGGTTIAGVHALEDGGFRASVLNAVTASYQKTLKLKK
ncbi:MAG: pyrroline-5-carboxylate reductase [Clostridia bacterium]|nr:pyrroline-5-carboxylate reductase [Clostridia bacterium]